MYPIYILTQTDFRLAVISIHMLNVHITTILKRLSTQMGEWEFDPESPRA